MSEINPHPEVWHAVLVFYREELRQRYSPENFRRFEEFQVISDADIARLRDFFLERIYPPAERRAAIDDGFQHLTAILHSPKRMKPLMRGALSSAWRLGRRLPAAISAGSSIVDAYQETRKVERHLAERAAEAGLRHEDMHDPQRMYRLLADFPEADVKRLIRDVVNLFRALNNRALLLTSLEFIQVCIRTMQKRPDAFTQEDIAAFELGEGIVREGLELFQELPQEEIPRLINGIESVELDWYREVKQAASGAEGSPAGEQVH